MYTAIPEVGLCVCVCVCACVCVHVHVCIGENGDYFSMTGKDTIIPNFVAALGPRDMLYGLFMIHTLYILIQHNHTSKFNICGFSCMYVSQSYLHHL